MTKPTTTWKPTDGVSTVSSESAPAHRMTEAGVARVTEDGNTRVVEDVTLTLKPKTDWSGYDG